MSQSLMVKVFVLTVALRGLIHLLFPTLQHQLDQSVEFSTPMTSYKSLAEGLFMFKYNMPLYSGGVIHHAPLLIILLDKFPIKLHSWIWITVDGIIACLITSIMRQLNLGLNDWIPGIIYALNPLTLLSCLSQSSIIWTNLLLVNVIYCIVVKKDLVTAAMSFTFLSYLDCYNVMLLFPLLTMLQLNRSKMTVFLMMVGVTMLALMLVSNPFDNWYQSVYVDRIMMSKVFPNLGLWWYFFIEMFQEFIPFFKSVFNLFCIGVIVPITIRFYQQPLYSFVICWSWIIMTKPYPTIGESGLLITLLPMFKPIMGYLKYPMFTSLLYLHAIILSPIFYYLWIDLGSGNSNFFYAISLVYCLAMGLIVTDLIWCMVRTEYDNGKPNFKLKLVQV